MVDQNLLCLTAFPKGTGNQLQIILGQNAAKHIYADIFCVGKTAGPGVVSCRSEHQIELVITNRNSILLILCNTQGCTVFRCRDHIHITRLDRCTTSRCREFCSFTERDSDRVIRRIRAVRRINNKTAIHILNRSSFAVVGNRHARHCGGHFRFLNRFCILLSIRCLGHCLRCRCFDYSFRCRSRFLGRGSRLFGQCSFCRGLGNCLITSHGDFLSKSCGDQRKCHSYRQSRCKNTSFHTRFSSFSVIRI